MIEKITLPVIPAAQSFLRKSDNQPKEVYVLIPIRAAPLRRGLPLGIGWINHAVSCCKRLQPQLKIHGDRP